MSLCIQDVYVNDGIIGLEGCRDLGGGYYNLKQSRSTGVGNTRRVLPLALDKGHFIIGGGNLGNVGRIRDIITEYIIAKICRCIINVDGGFVFTFKRHHSHTGKGNQINLSTTARN